MIQEEHNDLRPPYCKYDEKSNFYVSLDDIEDVKRKRKELEELHNVKCKSVWEGFPLGD